METTFKTKLICAFFSLISVFFFACGGGTPNTETETTTQTAGIKAVPLPTNIVPGFKFPEDSTVILNDWLRNFATQPPFDTVSIYKHAWGIWAGLTAKSGESYDGQDLLVYETWPGITDIRTMVAEGKTDCPTRSGHAKLARANQFDHAAALMKLNNTGGSIDRNPGFWVSVSYDPTAACHATKYQLLNPAVLNKKMVKGGIGAIEPFPNTAITIKPSYMVGHVADSLIKIPAWPGPPSPSKNFPDKEWNSWVYVDVNNRQPADKKIVPAPTDNPTPEEIAAATCNLNEFIYFKLNKEAADYINAQDSTQGVQAVAGDLALLVAMHVATKEISNWVWQTFFWSHNADNPASPSNAVAAGLRPSELQGAASHYAVSIAYSMTVPNQPITGGTNSGMKPVIGYNPYLEPSLGQINGDGPGQFPNKLNPAFKWGVQSNCMSCHALAAYPDNGDVYSADQYISLDDPYYMDKVQLDFAWSIKDNLLPAK
ncbi:MAG: hypothetical protein R3A50_16925 [Saprospiraceae bacterium]|nr:hypothetical protein [Lewinellaceae bacterium]